MSTYEADKDFTDYVHDNIAIPNVYNKLGWELHKESNPFSTDKDIHDGIDYTVYDKNGRKATIQERFRDNYYADKYDDVTIRYTRRFNPLPDRRNSEYFKITAKYFIYGIANNSKFKPERITGFEKLAILNLHQLFDKVDKGKLLVDETRRSSYLRGDTLYAGLNYNKDDSSEFIVLDVYQMQELWGNEVVKYTEGY